MEVVVIWGGVLTFKRRRAVAEHCEFVEVFI